MTIKEAELAEIQARIAAEEEKVSLLKKEVADKEGKVGMTVEEQDRLAELDRIIAEESAKVNKWQEEVNKDKAEISRLNDLIAIDEQNISKAKKAIDDYDSMHLARFGYTGHYYHYLMDERSSFVKYLCEGHNEIVSSQLIPAQKSLRTHQEQLKATQEKLDRDNIELERARRRLLDAQSSKSRAELEIRRAIALRQAELDAAKARLEMEERLLEQLKKES